MHPYEQGAGNGTQRILTTGGLGDEDKGKKEVGGSVLRLKYEPLSPPNGSRGGMKLFFCAACHVAFERHVIGRAGRQQCQQLMWLLAMHSFSSHH